MLTNNYHKYGKRWRTNNPLKRNEMRKKNYAATRKGAVNSKRLWSGEEIIKIFSPDRPCDRVLANQLGRSVQAIQIKRSKTVTPFNNTDQSP